MNRNDFCRHETKNRNVAVDWGQYLPEQPCEREQQTIVFTSRLELLEWMDEEAWVSADRVN